MVKLKYPVVFRPVTIRLLQGFSAIIVISILIVGALIRRADTILFAIGLGIFFTGIYYFYPTTPVIRFQKQSITLGHKVIPLKDIHHISITALRSLGITSAPYYFELVLNDKKTYLTNNHFFGNDEKLYLALLKDYGFIITKHKPGRYLHIKAEKPSRQVKRMAKK